MRLTLGLATLAVLLSVTVAEAPAHAADKAGTGVEAQTNPLADKIVELLELERLLDGMFQGMKGMFADNVIAAMERDQTQSSYIKTLFADGKGGREKFAAILGDEFVAALRSRYPEMKAVAAAEYGKIFTPAELSELVAFFSSGVGAKWRAQSPQVEKAMSGWGERAGMEAGGVALAEAFKRAEVEMLGKGNSQ